MGWVPSHYFNTKKGLIVFSFIILPYTKYKMETYEQFCTNLIGNSNPLKCVASEIRSGINKMYFIFGSRCSTIDILYIEDPRLSHLSDFYILGKTHCMEITIRKKQMTMDTENESY